MITWVLIQFKKQILNVFLKNIKTKTFYKNNIKTKIKKKTKQQIELKIKMYSRLFWNTYKTIKKLPVDKKLHIK